MNKDAMLKQSSCLKCKKDFSYNDNDRLGKFCSKKCHYGYKSKTVHCRNCNKEFVTQKTAGRVTCSKECWVLQKGIKSRNPFIQDMAKKRNATNGGQSSIYHEHVRSLLPILKPRVTLFDRLKNWFKMNMGW